MSEQKFINASKNLYYSSFLVISSIIMGNYHKLYYLSTSTFLILLTSINYWRYPIKGFRRNLDITIVHLSLLLHLYYCYLYKYYNYYILLIVGIISYIISNMSIKKELYCIGCNLHMFIHIIANINNLFLYHHIGMLESK